MRVLVTGATGDLGRVLVGRLCEEGHSVSVLTRRPFRAAEVLPAAVVKHEWHPISEPVPPEALDDIDAVLHLMGAPLAGGRLQGLASYAVSSRVNATRKLVAGLEGRRVRLVAASMALVPAESGPPLTEDMCAAAAVSSSPLERGVASWEAEALAAPGASVAVVRLGLVAMPGAPLDELIRLARKGIVPNLRGALVPMMGGEDAIRMLVGLLAQRSIEGIVHGVAPTPVAGEALMERLRSHGPRGRAIAVPLQLLGRRLGLLAVLLSCHRQIVPQRLLDAGADFVEADPLAALDAVMARPSSRREAGVPEADAERIPPQPAAGAEPV